MFPVHVWVLSYAFFDNAVCISVTESDTEREEKSGHVTRVNFRCFFLLISTPRLRLFISIPVVMAPDIIRDYFTQYGKS